MKDLTKLADWHQAMADEPKRNQAKREKHAETARILRSAAAGDVQNLIDNYGLAVAKGDRDATIKYRAALESALRLALAARPSLSVWYGSMPESNGRTNWTATLRNGDMHNGFTFARSQYPHRVRYAADEVRHLIGELPKRPSILDYDADEQTPCHLCGGTGEVDGKPCWGLNFKGTVHQAAAAPKGTT